MAREPGARLIAGATELGLDITKTLSEISGADFARSDSRTDRDYARRETEWTIGAATTLTRLDDTIGDEYPELRDMLLVFGSRQIRNRATLGGNLVTASPIGDSAPVLLALDARVVLASAAGERTLPIDEFFVSYRKTALQPGEILKSILLPRIPPDVRSIRRFYKVSKRREMDISTVAGAFAVRLTRKRHDRACAARLRRSRGHAGARPRDGAGADRQTVATRDHAMKFCQFWKRNSRRSPTCAAARLIGRS